MVGEIGVVFVFMRVVLGFFYCADWDAKGVFAMEELQEDHDAFGAVVGEEDGLEFFVTAAGDAHLVTGFQCYGVFG